MPRGVYKRRQIGKGHPRIKLSRDFVQTLKDLLAEDENYVLLTDEKILTVLNERLSHDCRIGAKTFQEWKSGKTPKNAPEEAKAFRLLIKRALVKQEMALMKKMQEGHEGWQRFAWIMERKFSEWNIRRKTDLTSEGNAIIGFNFIVPKPTEPVVKEDEE